MKYYCYYKSPVGLLTIGCNDNALKGLWLENQQYYPSLTKAAEHPTHPILVAAVQWLKEYFCGLNPDPERLPIALTGTPFQKSVWQALLQIPYGTTISYKELAINIGCPRGYQAVGAAVGRNPVSIIVPCHRVIGASGSLTGFAGGLTAKKWLLYFEQQ